MRPFSRRSVLKGGLATAAALSLPRLSRGTSPPGSTKVLEIFLKGGFSPWRSFWNETDFSGLEDEPDWATFGAPANPTPDVVSGLHGDELGPSAAPLFGTTLMQRCRALAMAHDLEPHEVALPYAVTGTHLGRPQLCGTATAVNAMIGDGSPLHAFVIDGGNAESASYASQAGQLDPIYRPPVIRVGTTGLLTSLARTGVTAYDAVETLLADQYAAAMVHSATAPNPVRSRGFSAYDASEYLLHNWSDELLAMLGLTSIEDVPATTTWQDNKTRLAVRVAAELLKLPDHDVRYVAAIDAGVFLTYDTHNNFDQQGPPGDQQAGNLYNLCSILAELDSALDSEGAPLLDGVMVVLNTEFGRLQINGNESGTEHWPYGYVNVLMGAGMSDVHHRGGFDAGARAVAGPMGRGPYNPADLRAVIADYLGITDLDSMMDTSELSEPISTLRTEIL